MKEIGGYFQLEMTKQQKLFPHANGILVNTGRNALEHILQSLQVNVLHIPYFTCDVLLEPLQKLGVETRFYHINAQLEIAEPLTLAKDEYLLYTNYYGIKDAYANQLGTEYGSHLIVDNAQAFYAPYQDGTQAFYSPRKFVGIPDGGVAYITVESTITLPTDQSHDRCSHLLKRYDLDAGAGYAEFKANSTKLKQQPIMAMSALTLNMMNSIDFEEINQKRRANFDYLHRFLEITNQLIIPSTDSFACPMVYPYFTTDLELRKKLIERKVFIAIYWPNVLEWCKKEDIEYQLADKVIAIPIDQRYGDKEMKFIIENVLG